MSKKEKTVEEEYILSPINNPMLNYKVYLPSKQEKLFYYFIATIAGGLTSLLFFGGLFKKDGEATMMTYISDVVVFVLVGFLVAKIIYPVFVLRRKEKRDAKVRKQFRDLLEALSASFSSGVNANEAFTAAYNDMLQQYGEDSYISVEVKEILNGVNQNYSVSKMLMSFADRTGNDDIENFANVYQVAVEKGADLKAVIRRTHSILSGKMAVNDEIQTKLASNKLQHNVMSLMPIGIVAILRFTNESFTSSFATPMGIIVNIIAVMVFAGSYVLGQKICDIK